MELKKSSTMSALPSENNTIRMSEELRKKMNVSPGDILVVKGFPLQVNKLFAKDICSKNKAFVSEKVLKELGIETHELSVEQHVSIGCDPELFLVDTTTNKLYNPGFIVKKEATVGYDGMLAEFRPPPDVDPKQVTYNIWQLIKSLKSTLESKDLTNVRMVSRSSGWGLFAGFHVHLGIPRNLLNPTKENYLKIIQIIVSSLDYYLGTLSVLVEKDDYERRCSPFTPYGKVGDFRADNHITLEYRVPGGALLSHPYLTDGLLNIASLITHDVIERVRIITDDFRGVIDDDKALLKHIYPNIVETTKMYDIICSPNTNAASMELATIQKDLSCMVNYDYYKKSIDSFYNLLKVKISDDILTNWDNTYVQ